MDLESTVADLSELKPHGRGVERTYSTFRERTEREFGCPVAESVERAVSDIFSCIVRRIAGQLRQEDEVAILQKRDWRASDDSKLLDALISCHDLASAEQRGQLAGHSQFEGALSLKSLNEKYFGQNGDRTTVFVNENLPGAILSISNLGDPPSPDYAFGLKAVLPPQADYLLWWATKQSKVWEYFAEPNDLDEKSWAILKSSLEDKRTRPFAKCILGKVDWSLGPSRREERLYLAPFGPVEFGSECQPSQGSYLAYHVL